MATHYNVERQGSSRLYGTFTETLRDDSNPRTLRDGLASLRFWRRDDRLAALDEHARCSPDECADAEAHHSTYTLIRTRDGSADERLSY